MNEIAVAKVTYEIIGWDEDNNTTMTGGDVCIDQLKGDRLEVWKVRNDGFIFVYCNRLTLGYWVNPGLITIFDIME